MKPFARSERVRELIRQVLSELIMKEIKDPRLATATVTNVKLSADLKHAKIYYATGVGQDCKDDVEAGFQSALGYIKRELAAKVKLRYMPDLHFYYDDSFDYGDKIERLLDTVASDLESEPLDHDS